MNRSELIALIQDDGVYITKKEATRIVTTFFDAITDQLSAGGRVEVRGFGTFTTRQRDGYVGHHPVTFRREAVKPKRVAWFRPSEILARRLYTSTRADGGEGSELS